jgi:hypothetical protein
MKQGLWSDNKDSIQVIYITYTANGIVDFLKEVDVSLPENIAKVFFRADSVFFSGKLFDLLESFGWDYLVKVKLKKPVILLKKQEWEVIDTQKDIAICEFVYKADLLLPNSDRASESQGRPKCGGRGSPAGYNQGR